jgi:uncharacterized protein (DUF1499 family)
MEPLPYAGTREASRDRLLAALRALPRATIVVDEPLYLHLEVRSRLFRFVDDVEFSFDDGAGTIHFRSAARRGWWDLGVNRARMRAIRRAYGAG